MIENRYKKKFSKYSIENPDVWALSQEEGASKDIPFLLKIFKKFGKIKTVLDVGCGVGSHVEELRLKKYISFGTDANPEMIEYAKKRYPLNNFKVQDMRLLNLNQKFDAIICLHGVIHFALTNEEVFSTIKRFYSHIKKGGLVLIDFTSWIRYIEKQKFSGHFISKDDDLKKYGVYEEITDTINERKQTAINKRTFYDIKTKKKVGTYFRETRIFFPQEIMFFLEQAGFRVLDAYSADSIGKMSFNYEQLDKRRILIIAKRN